MIMAIVVVLVMEVVMIGGIDKNGNSNSGCC